MNKRIRLKGQGAFLELPNRTPKLDTDTPEGRICIDGTVCEKKPQPLDNFTKNGFYRNHVCKACTNKKAKDKKKLNDLDIKAF